MSCNEIDDLREVADEAYSQAAILGLHAYAITVILIKDIGVDIFGEGGAPEIIRTRLTLQGCSCDGYLNPKLEQVNSKDIFLSGGILTDTDYKVGPLIYPYTSCDGYQKGIDLSVSNPEISENTNIRLYFEVIGPEFPTAGYFKRISSRADSNISYYLFIRNTGERSVT